MVFMAETRGKRRKIEVIKSGELYNATWYERDSSCGGACNYALEAMQKIIKDSLYWSKEIDNINYIIRTNNLY